MPNYWLMKSEPNEYSYQDLEREGRTHWDGVRNHQAQKNMRAMKVGDLVLIYHSVGPKTIVGIAKVVKEHYPDPTADPDTKWQVVDIVPVKAFTDEVSLKDIKAREDLADIALVRQSRLSVMPLEKTEFKTLLAMGNTKL
jgi:predicted RNA-binding protein with PUA-like domain